MVNWGMDLFESQTSRYNQTHNTITITYGRKQSTQSECVQLQERKIETMVYYKAVAFNWSHDCIIKYSTLAFVTERHKRLIKLVTVYEGNVMLQRCVLYPHTRMRETTTARGDGCSYRKSSWGHRERNPCGQSLCCRWWANSKTSCKAATTRRVRMISNNKQTNKQSQLCIKQ